MTKTSRSTTSSAAKRNSRVPAPPAPTPSEAQRLAAAILEVLAGLRSPPAAAELLSISLPRYYQLEARALEGLVAALAPRPLGKQPSLEKRVKQLEKELDAAKRASARQEALVRLTQRSMGLVDFTKTKPAPAANGKSRKPRQPMVRALKAAQTLRAKADASGEANRVDVPETASLQPSVAADGVEVLRP